MGRIRKAEEVLLKSRWSEQSKRTALDYQLWDKVWSFSDYFTDMLFEPGSILDSFLKYAVKDKDSEEWIDSYAVCHNGIHYFSYEYFYYRVRPLKGPYLACFNRKSYSLTVDPRHLDDDFPILHEMIHMHETVLNIYPQYYRDTITFSLYKELCNRMDPEELDTQIKHHLHVVNQQNYASNYGEHDLLFLLKSFDLDFKMGYKPGTVFGYGLNSLLK